MPNLFIFVKYNIQMFSFITIKEVQEEFGEWCKSLRKNEKMTQQELAEQLAVSRITIANLEKGKNFTIDTFLKVMQYFGQLEKINQFIKSTIIYSQSFY